MSAVGCRDVARFIELYCQYQEIRRETIRDNVYRFVLDGEPITYTHQPEQIGVQSAEFITYGHPVLDRLVNSARSQGWTANLIYPLSSENYESFREKLTRLPLKGVNRKPLKTTLLYHARLAFIFRLSLLADIRKDLLITLAADPENDQVEIWEMPERLCSLPEGFRPRPDRRRYPKLFREQGSMLENHLANLHWLREIDYRTFQLYRQACVYLNRWITETFAPFEEEQLRRLQREEQVLDEYYDTLLREEMARLYELLHKAAVLEVRVALAKSAKTRELFSSQLQDYHQQIEAEKDRCSRYGQSLAAEKSKRLFELKSKYTPQALVSLVSAARVYLPRAVIAIENRFNKLETVRLVYDFHADTWLDLQCQGCGRLPFGVLVTAESGLLCSRCVEACEVCGEATKAPASICAGCGRKVCEHCQYPCLLSSSVRRTPCELCRHCGCELCPACKNLVQVEEIQA